MSSTAASIRPAPHPRDRPDLARLPPMGWNSWNCFRTDIDETTLLEVADALVISGMRDAGYDTFVVDDCWQAHTRDTDGRLRAHPDRFPSGMAWLGDQLRSRGLAFGLYASPGRKTCAMIYDRYPGVDLGSFGREQLDADSFASWGVDFLKYDWCEADEDGTGLRHRDAFARMATALRRTGRDMILSISEYGRTEPWTWAADLGHMWRISPDIEPAWQSVLDISDRQAQVASFSRPGAWNDPDMLQVGNAGLSEAQSATHFAAWCFFAAPLFAGHDPRTMSESTRLLLTDPQLVTIDQDPLGRSARRLHGDGRLDVWERTLGDGPAWLVVNRSDHELEVTYDGVRLHDDRGPLALVGPSVQALRSDDTGRPLLSQTTTLTAHGSLAVRTVT